MPSFSIREITIAKFKTYQKLNWIHKTFSIKTEAYNLLQHLKSLELIHNISNPESSTWVYINKIYILENKKVNTILISISHILQQYLKRIFVMFQPYSEFFIIWKSKKANGQESKFSFDGNWSWFINHSILVWLCVYLVEVREFCF